MSPVARARRRAAAGVALVAAAWCGNWFVGGLRTQFFFFPLWLGYVLAVDGLTALCRGDSLLERAPRQAWRLFALSAPIWWLFELVNLRTRNWEYLGRERFGDLEYALFATLSFSTVLPAVLETAELVRGAPWLERFARGPCLRPTARLARGLAAAGVAAAALLLVWPRACYPFVWVAPVLLLEPLAYRLGRRSLLSDLARGDWRPWMSLWIGGLACGFLWELWNARSYPKWIYHVPGVDGLHVFEMPLLGYLGYLPFAQALFLLKELVLPRPRLSL